MGSLCTIVKGEGNPVCDKADSVTTFEVSCSLSLSTMTNIPRKSQRESLRQEKSDLDCTMLLIMCNISLKMRQSYLSINQFIFLQRLTLKCWPSELHTYYYTTTHNNYNPVIASNLPFSEVIVLKIILFLFGWRRLWLDLDIVSYKHIVFVHAGSLDICVSGVWKQSSVNLCRLRLIFFYTLSRSAQQRAAITSSLEWSQFEVFLLVIDSPLMGCYGISGEVKHNKLHLF